MSRLFKLGSWALAAGATFVAVGTHAGAAAPVGVLPIHGSEEMRAKLTALLVPALRQRLARRVEEPGPVVARLSSVRGTTAAKRAARATIARAESHEFKMERPLALDAATRAIEQLRRVGVRFHSPALWTEAQLALARAQLLSPPDPDAARLSLRAAVQASPDIIADKYPPRLARLLTQVKQQRVAASPPHREELSSLAARAGLGSIVWVAVRSRGKRIEVRLATHDRAQGSYALVERTLPAADLASRLAELVAWSLGPGAVAGGAKPPEPGTRWYQRWWVWAAAGTVVAAVTAGVIYATLPDDSFTFHIETTRR